MTIEAMMIAKTDPPTAIPTTAGVWIVVGDVTGAGARLGVVDEYEGFRVAVPLVITGFSVVVMV